MNPPARRFSWTLAIGLLLMVLTLVLVFVLAQAGRSPGAGKVSMFPQIADFALTNQNSEVVSPSDLKGKVWIADIIFTRCPGPCARMTRQMKEIETELGPESEVKLVTLTTDPDFDTPRILSQYAERFQADTNRWMFLTGSKRQIADVAIGSLKLAAIEKEPEQRESADDLFVHSTIFVVVDKRGYLRGIHETGGENVDWARSKQALLDEVKMLEREK